MRTDEQRIDNLGARGNRDIRTPHIDALAADSVGYPNSFCPSPVCTPSRYSLLSGRYVREHQESTNRSTLAPEIATFPRALRAARYKTTAVGKMHFTPTYLDVGFDEMVLAEQDGDARWDNDYHRDLMHPGLVGCNDLEDQRREYRNKDRAVIGDGILAMYGQARRHPSPRPVHAYGNRGCGRVAWRQSPRHPGEPPCSRHV